MGKTRGKPEVKNKDKKTSIQLNKNTLFLFIVAKKKHKIDN